MSKQIVKHLETISVQELLEKLQLIVDEGYQIDIVQRTSPISFGSADWLIVYRPVG
jgi:hypothetical protein